MASGRRGASETGQTPGGRRGRTPPTIDLTATEVASEPVSEPAPDPAPEPPPASPPEPPPAEPAHAADASDPPPAAPHAAQAATASQAAQAENPTQAQTERPSGQGHGPWPPSDRQRTLVAGGLAGAAASVAILVALWLFGAFAPRDDSAALAAKVAALDTQVRDLAARRTPAVDAKTVEDMRARIDVIDAGLRRVDDRLARAESTLATPRSAPTDPAVLERLAAAESMQRALTATIADLRQRIDDVATTARDAKSRADAAPQADATLRNEVEALAARVAALEHAERTTDQRIDQSMAGASAADRAVRLAFVAGALRAAAERGAPFAAELAAAKTLGADAAALAPLEPFAAAGVPGADTLARDLDKLEPAMMAAAAPPTHDGGILDRLQANAERLVRVRPVGDTPGDDPAAGLARATAKAHRGDIAGALAEVERLPPAVKAPAADWIKAAQARTAALDAARQLVAGSLAALGKPSP
jgi:hypothetical protein